MIVAGLGFRSDATLNSLFRLYDDVTHGRMITAIATADDKARTGVFEALATQVRLPVIPVASDVLSTQPTLTQSVASRSARATGSVAEAAALAAAGPGGHLLGPRLISADGMATCALAEGPGI